MVRYSLLRILIFFGFLFLFWLIGLRNNPVLLLGASAIASAAASYILLRGMRDEITAKLVERHEAQARGEAGRSTRRATSSPRTPRIERADDPTPTATADGPRAAAGPPARRVRQWWPRGTCDGLGSGAVQRREAEVRGRCGVVADAEEQRRAAPPQEVHADEVQVGATTLSPSTCTGNPCSSTRPGTSIHSV